MRSSSGQLLYTEDAYNGHEITLSTSAKNLEMMCELLVEFDNMKDNIDLLTFVKFQVWELFFNRIRGGIFNHLVREFWIHAKSMKIIMERRLLFCRSLLPNSLDMMGLESNVN